MWLSTVASACTQRITCYSQRLNLFFFFGLGSIGPDRHDHLGDEVPDRLVNSVPGVRVPLFGISGTLGLL